MGNATGIVSGRFIEKGRQEEKKKKLRGGET